MQYTVFCECRKMKTEQAGKEAKVLFTPGKDLVVKIDSEEFTLDPKGYWKFGGVNYDKPLPVEGGRLE